MKPAASYLRCSTNAQAEASIPEQRDAIRREADKRGFKIIEEFKEPGLSGTSTARPRLQELIAACEDGREWTDIFVWDRSRLGRPEDPIDLLMITSRIAKAGKKIIPLHGAQTTGNKMVDSIVELIEFAQAGQESVNKSRNVIRGQLAVAERGSRNGGRTPYGYDGLYLRDREPVRRVRYTPGRTLVSLDGKRLLEDLGRGSIRDSGDTLVLTPGEDEKIKAVRRIYEEFTSGRPMRTIVRDLNADGVPAPRGGRWGRTTVKSILKNPAYRGRHVWNRHTRAKFYRAVSGGKIIRAEARETKSLRFNSEDDWIAKEGAWKALVDPETWDAAQARLASAPKTPRSLRGRGADSPYLASGLLECTCGRHWTGSSYLKKRARQKEISERKESDYNLYYRCLGRDNGCESRSIRRDVLDGYLETRIAELYHEPAIQAALWREIVAEIDAVLDIEDAAPPGPGEKFAAIEERIQRLVSAVEDGVIEHDEAKARLQAARAEKRALQRKDGGSTLRRRSAAERRSIRNAAFKAARAHLYDEASLWRDATPADRKRIVRAHVQRIDVDPAANRATVAFYPLLAGFQGKSLWHCARRPQRR